MSRLAPAIVILSLMMSCQSGSLHKVFKPEVISSEFFTINIAQDTSLHTKNGAIITIPAGALESSGSTVQLEIKEAYHISEMIKAGLLTQSNGQLLSSGGMIYVNAVGENTVTIKKALKISLPSNSIDKEMELFKGKTDADGNLNWTNPASLQNEEYLSRLASGKAMFMGKCASCHAISKVVAGPALAHIYKRRDRKWLFEYTRNNRAMLQGTADTIGGDWLANCLYERWNRLPMNLFPELDDSAMQVLYDYIEDASKGLPVPDDGLSKECIDSCEAYYKLAGSRPMVNEKRDPGAPVNDTFEIVDTPIEPVQRTQQEDVLIPVNPQRHPSLYYQFTIESFGWYNVDILLKPGPGMIESNLMVRIRGQYRERLNIYLVIPSIRVFTAAGKAGKKDEYVFAARDGKIFLPQHSKAYIIVMGDKREDILFTKTVFNVKASQQFELSPVVVTKEQFNYEMKQLNFDQLNIRAEVDSNFIKNIGFDQIENMKPKNCDCDCMPINTVPTNR